MSFSATNERTASKVFGSLDCAAHSRRVWQEARTKRNTSFCRRQHHHPIELDWARTNLSLPKGIRQPASTAWVGVRQSESSPERLHPLAVVVVPLLTPAAAFSLALVAASCMCVAGMEKASITSDFPTQAHATTAMLQSGLAMMQSCCGFSL